MFQQSSLWVVRQASQTSTQKSTQTRLKRRDQASKIQPLSYNHCLFTSLTNLIADFLDLIEYWEEVMLETVESVRLRQNDSGHTLAAAPLNGEEIYKFLKALRATFTSLPHFTKSSMILWMAKGNEKKINDLRS